MGEEYVHVVEKYASNRLDETIPNCTTKHAHAGLLYLIKNAEKKIRAVSHYFYDNLWDYLYFPLDDFLSKKNGELEFIILNKIEKDDKIIDLKESYPDKVKIYSFERRDVIKKIPEFVTIDDCGYRYGLSDEERKGKMVTGVINFGNKECTTSLNSMFELLKSKSREENLERFLKTRTEFAFV